MNILVAGGCDIPPPYGGVATRILNIARVWENEHQVHLLLLWGKRNPDLLGTRFTRLHTVFPARPTGRLAKLATLSGVRLPTAAAAVARKRGLSLAVLRHVRLLLTGRRMSHAPTTLIDALAYAAAVDDLVARERIEVIQAHYARQESLLCEIVAARHGIPVVVFTYSEAVCWPASGEEITSDNLYGDMPRWDPLFKRAFEQAAHVCACSEHCAQGARRFIPDDRISITYPTIETAALQAARERRDEYARQMGLTDKKVILYVGQLTPRKGPQFLAHAVPDILNAQPHTQFIFIGPDVADYRRELESMLGSQRDSATFAGAVPNETLRQYLAVADALAFPTCTERECFGLSMVEAMAVGAPVVAFRVGGTPEVVKDGKTGYLVDVGDTQALADRLVAVLRGDLGPDAPARCREVVMSRFDVRSGAALEYQILAKAVAVARGGAPSPHVSA